MARTLTDTATVTQDVSVLNVLKLNVPGLSIAAGKAFLVSNSLTLAGTDGSTLNIGTGGTLGSLAFSSSVAASALTGTTLAATVTVSSLTTFGASFNKVAITSPATGCTLTIADGKTLTVSNTLTFTGTDGSSVAFGAGGTVAYLGATNPFTKQQGFGAVALTDAVTIVWDVSIAQSAKVTLAGNRTMGAPTNMVDGFTYILRVKQDATGTRTLTFPTGVGNYQWPGGTVPVLSTAANALDIFTFTSDGVTMFGVAQKAFA